MLTHVTFTGWDDRTDPFEFATFCRDQQPGTVEIAVLMSASHLGEDRYPCVEIAESILRIAKRHRQRAAVHVCGEVARRMLLAGRPDSGPATRVVDLADRIQVNVAESFWAFVGGYAAADRLADGIDRPVIIQVRGLEWPAKQGRVQYLFDRSAGRGEVAEQVPPLTNFPVGYAGGLGPENVDAFLQRLMTQHPGVLRDEVVFTAPIWIDMESGIRESMSAFPGGPPQPPAGSDKVTPVPTYVSVAKCQQVMDAVRWALMPE